MSSNFKSSNNSSSSSSNVGAQKTQLQTNNKLSVVAAATTTHGKNQQQHGSFSIGINATNSESSGSGHGGNKRTNSERDHKHISFNLGNNTTATVHGSEASSVGGGGGRSSSNELKITSSLQEPTTPSTTINTPRTVTVPTTFFPPSPTPFVDNDLPGNCCVMCGRVLSLDSPKFTPQNLLWLKEKFKSQYRARHGHKIVVKPSFMHKY
jgi:hypothetical protein